MVEKYYDDYDYDYDYGDYGYSISSIKAMN